MTPSNEMCPICSYAGSAQYCEWPSPEQIRQGVVPLDSLPAAWWNNMWADATNRINEARDMIGQVITEINNVLTQAGFSPQSACTDQLYQSINKIRQVLATDSIPGAVLSSNAGGAVCVANDGTMSINCLGNVAALTTSAHTVVGAVNELKSTYDCCISDLQTYTSSLDSGKAPTNHASTATIYGVGNATNYGHVKLSDTYSSCVGAAADGVAASQKALYDMYTCITGAGYVTLGNSAGCALGTASAGSASTAARSDHVHPTLTCVSCAGQSYCVMDYCSNATPIYTAYAGAGLTCAQVTHLAAFSTNYVSGKTVIKDASKATIQSWLGLASAAYCAASCFRASTWTPSCVSCSGCATCARCILNSAGTAAYCIYIS